MDIWDKIEQERLASYSEADARNRREALKRKCSNCGESPAYTYTFMSGPMYTGTLCAECEKRYSKKYGSGI